jgi:hypothetical protein
LRDSAHIPDYVDQSRTHLNSVIIEPPDPATVRAEIAEHRQQAGQQKLRADARTTIGGIITFGKEAQPIIEALPREEQDAIFLREARRVAKEADRPLLGLVVHRDESAIHAHFTLRGYKLENGKEVAPRLSRTDLQRIQDAAAQEVAHLGIERGVSRAIREARGDDRAKVVHRSVKELHEALPREIEAVQAHKLAIEQEVAALAAKRANNERLAEKARRDLEDGKGYQAALQKRLAVYEERARKAEERAKALEGEAVGLDAAIIEKQQRTGALDAEIQSKERRLAELDQQAVEVIKQETRTVLRSAEHTVKIKTGLFSSQNQAVVYAKDHRRYAGDMENQVHRIARVVVTEKNRADMAEAREQKLERDPQIAQILAERKAQRIAQERMAREAKRALGKGQER